MFDEVAQDENPYASPDYMAPAGVEPDGRIHSTRAPADILDVLIGIANVALILAIVLGIPVAVASGVAVLFALGAASPALSVAVTVLIFLPTGLWALWVSGRIVDFVSVDEYGLHFHRRFRGPDNWPWHTITSIRPATRWEVVWHGWIRPLLSPHERTSCASALGHYRIQGKTDYCFFPPQSPEVFVEMVARYRPDLLKPLE